MSVLRKLAYACIPVVALLGLGEGIARLAGPSGFIIYPTQGNCLQRSMLLGDELRPHCTAVSGGKPYHTNALGLRDSEVADDGRQRILAIGDSCTFGWGVDQDAAYPQLLQQRLDRGPQAGRYRVINAGVPGYTSYHGRLYLAERGTALKPAVVIAGYGFNDIVPTGDVRAALDWQRRIMPVLRLDDTLMDWSMLWRRMRIATQRPLPPDGPLRSSPEQYAENLREIVRLGREAGAQVMLIDFLARSSPQREYLAAVKTTAEELGVPLIIYDGPRIDVIHPTPEGDAWLAAEVERRLGEIGVVAQ